MADTYKHIKIPIFTLFLSLGMALSVHAGNATWSLNPTNNDWYRAANWTPASVPNGPTDTATFGVSNSPTPTISGGGDIEVSSIVFEPGASAYTITPDSDELTINGAGVVNNSGIVQNFLVKARGSKFASVIFRGEASAGSLTTFTSNSGTGEEGGGVFFDDEATAADATFINNGAAVGSRGGGGGTTFLGGSDGNATFINNGATVTNGSGSLTFIDGAAVTGNGTFINNGGRAPNANGGATLFYASGPGNRTITSNGTIPGAFAGSVRFELSSSAYNATLIANGGANGGPGGRIEFNGNSLGGTARVELSGNGFLTLANHHSSSVTIGSLEGDGIVLLGPTNLTVGSNNLSTVFSGVIQDSGSVTKIGSGILTLSGASIYTGNTTLNDGALRVGNTTGSATGTGSVNLNDGTLEGTGTISGAVTIGTGDDSGAFLAPGRGASQPATLTIQSALTFKAGATYSYKLNTKKAKADQVVAEGVTIENGAQFDFNAVANRKLAAGQIFTALGNTAATPIAGAFSNLPDDSTFTRGRNSFQVDYQGGDGNDLTLTVVP